jgi:lysophospholipase L1-like esterase
MPNADAPTDLARVARAILLGVACVLLALAVVYNEWTLLPLARGEFSPVTRERIRALQLGFALAGGLVAALAVAVGRIPPLSRLFRARGVTPLLLTLAALLPFLLIDFGLRPFVDAKTNLFERDDRLGWKMVPGAGGAWGEVPVEVSARGLRGPVVPDARTPDTRRVLFLGDSVTFGYGVAPPDATFPFAVGRALERPLGQRVEIVNAGVGGYSPWQQLAWFEQEGRVLAPDAVVVGFVLNDVTEKLALVRYGGRGEGWQLARTAHSSLERFLSGSALYTTLREGAAVLRFGRDVRFGATAVETRDVRQLVEDPRRPEFERAWKITLNNLERLFGLAQKRDVPALLVVFPYAFQLEAPAAAAGPQRRLADFAREHGIAQLDLLPVLAGEDSPFLDASHLSEAGHAKAAEAIAPRVAALLGAAP